MLGTLLIAVGIVLLGVAWRLNKTVSQGDLSWLWMILALLGGLVSTVAGVVLLAVR